MPEKHIFLGRNALIVLKLFYILNCLYLANVFFACFQEVWNDYSVLQLGLKCDIPKAIM